MQSCLEIFALLAEKTSTCGPVLGSVTISKPALEGQQAKWF